MIWMKYLYSVAASLVAGIVPPALLCLERLAWQVLPGSHCQSAVVSEGCPVLPLCGQFYVVDPSCAAPQIEWHNKLTESFKPYDVMLL